MEVKQALVRKRVITFKIARLYIRHCHYMLLKQPQTYVALSVADV